MSHDDERPLSLAQRRALLAEEARHWTMLTNDARVLRLHAIYQRRRDRLRQLREQLEHLDSEQTGDTAHAHAPR